MEACAVMSTPKDTTYFPHDSNAKDDPKIMMLISQLGLEAYGIYWILIEYLREQPGYQAPLMLLDPLSRRFGSSREKFEAIVKNYGLFETDDFNFRSPSLISRMIPLEKKREQQRLNAEKRWGKDATALPPHSDGITTAMQRREEESKGENSKVEENREKKTVPPSFESLSRYCIERKNGIDPQQFYDFYQSKGWMIGKDKMKDWQAAIRTWEQRNAKNPSHTNPGEDPIEKGLKGVKAARKARLEREQSRESSSGY